MLALLLLAAVAATPVPSKVVASPPDSSASDHESVVADVRSAFDNPSVEKAKAAEERVREWVKRNPGSAGGQLVFLVSQVWFACQEYREALRVLDWLEAEWKNELYGHAALGSAECWKKLGDTERMIEALERATEAPPRATHLGIMDAGNTTSAAIFQLAPLREERKEWEQALRLWERWEPRASCGNELEGFRASRIRGIARCQAALGNSDSALATLSSAELDSRLNGFDRTTARLWIRIAGEAKRVDSIEELLDRLYLASKPPEVGTTNAQLRYFAARSRLKEVTEVLLEVGDPAREWLKRRSSRGDAHAATLEAAMAGVFPAFKKEELQEGFVIPPEE